MTSFEKMASKLGLCPQDYEASDRLREWARRNMNEKYVPVHLLVAWGLPTESVGDPSETE